MKKIILMGAGDLLSNIYKNVDWSNFGFRVASIYLSNVDIEEDTALLEREGYTPNPIRINSEMFSKDVSSYDPDIILCIGLREILTSSVISIPKNGVVNLHGALLPMQRGSGGDYGAIINDDEYGLTTHFMDEKIDSGNIICSVSWTILGDDTKLDLIEKAQNEAPNLIKSTLKKLRDNKVFLGEYQDKFAYYPRKPDWDEYINWSESSDLINRKIRARYPYPLNFTIVGDQVLFVSKSELCPKVKSYHAPVGQVISIVKGKGVVIKTGDSAILITEVGAGSLSMLEGRGKYPYQLPSQYFVPEYHIGTVFGINIYQKYYALLEKFKEIDLRLKRIEQ